MRLTDDDVGKCLRFLTELSREEIEELDRSREEEPEKRDSQHRLAEELTRMVHGDEGLNVARRATEILFGAEINDLNDQQLAAIFADVPSSEMSRGQLSGEGLPLIDAFVAAGLSKSKGEARRTIQQGGAYVNNRRQSSIDTTLSLDDLASESTMVLRSGKKNYALLRFSVGS